MDDDRVFKALADPTRRRLLDRLFARDGRTLTELESETGDDPLRRHEAPARPRGGRPRRYAPIGAGKAALSQPGPDSADSRPLDRQIPRAPRLGARVTQARAGEDRNDHYRREPRAKTITGLPRVHQGDAAGDLGRDHPARLGGASTATPARQTYDLRPGGAFEAFASDADEGPRRPRRDHRRRDASKSNPPTKAGADLASDLGSG